MRIIKATSRSGTGDVYLAKIDGLQVTMSPKKSEAIAVETDKAHEWIRSVRMTFPDASVSEDP